MANVTLTQEHFDLLMELAAKGREARYEIKRLCTLGRPLTRWDFQTALFGGLFNAIDAVDDVKPQSSGQQGPGLSWKDGQPPQWDEGMTQDDKLNPDFVAQLQAQMKGKGSNAKRNADRKRTRTTKSRSKRSAP